MHYVAGAFPSACGKTNLAMLVPPAALPGWKAFTVGDDIAWLRPGSDGRLWAVNPEAGFFGVVPGTSRKTNPTAFEMIQRNTIYTNVALRPDGTPWWEGHDDPAAGRGARLAGTPVDAGVGREGRASQQPVHDAGDRCASLSPEFDNPNGVPIDAILFGARRQRRVPLVYEVAQLAARHVSRRDAVVGDDRGGDRQGRRPAARSDGDAGRSAATTWATTSRTGSTSAQSSRIRRGSSA